MRRAFENNVHRYRPKRVEKGGFVDENLCGKKTWIKVDRAFGKRCLQFRTREAYVAASRTGTGRKGVFGTSPQVPNSIQTQQAPARHLQPMQVQ